MIKKNIYGDDLKARLLAGTNDRMYNFILAGGKIRGAVQHCTRVINEMRANHELGILETLVLGHAYIGCCLLSANLKGNDLISMSIDCSGPIKGLSVEANAYGEVRGYLKKNPIPVESPLKDFNLSPFFGAGFLTITKYLEDAKKPFSSKVELKYGNIAQDLAYYYFTSEQIPTVFDLSIKFDSNGNVIGAGGLFLQIMPDISNKTKIKTDAKFATETKAETKIETEIEIKTKTETETKAVTETDTENKYGTNDELALQIEALIKDFPSFIGYKFAKGEKPDKFIEEYFSNFDQFYKRLVKLESLCCGLSF